MYHVSGLCLLPLILGRLALLDLLLQPGVLLRCHHLLTFFILQVFAFEPVSYNNFCQVMLGMDKSWKADDQCVLKN